MPHGQRKRVPVPTLEEINEAVEAGRGISGCAGVEYQSLIALKLVCRNGDTATVLLDPVARSELLRALIALSPKDIELRAAPVIVGTLGLTVQRGYLPD